MIQKYTLSFESYSFNRAKPPEMINRSSHLDVITPTFKLGKIRQKVGHYTPKF